MNLKRKARGMGTRGFLRRIILESATNLTFLEQRDLLYRVRQKKVDPMFSPFSQQPFGISI